MCPKCGTAVVAPDESPETAKRIEYHVNLIRRRICQRLDEHGTLAEKWLEKGITCPNAECQAFVSLGRDGGSCFSVTRHDFDTKGVTCPNCKKLAAEPGEWKRVQTAERIERDKKGIEKERWTEEGVCCWNCDSYLMASPDSDVDPLELGQEYDRNIYHKFVKPEGWTPPIQATSDREVVVDDWVVINRGIVITIDGKKQDVGGTEGRVVSIEEGIVEIKRKSLFPLGKATNIKINIEHCRPMVFETLKPEVAIRVIRGKYQGEKGVVLECDKAQITVRLENGVTTTLPIERFVREDS